VFRLLTGSIVAQAALNLVMTFLILSGVQPTLALLLKTVPATL
jgi:hypothetical protein